MKFTLISFALFLLILTACTVQEKERTAEATDSVPYSMVTDTLSLSAMHEPSSIDSSKFQSATEASAFNKKNPESYLILANYLVEDFRNDPNVAQTVDSTCAVLISPNEEQFENMRSSLGDDFPVIVDDYMYYHGIAIEMLDSADVETITAEKQFLVFMDGQKSWPLDIRKENAPEWNLIFYRKGKAPEIVSSIDLSHDDIISYFQK